ncbi:endothelin-converting enzyme 1-like [Haemaphysalis longicornis]
MFSGFPLGFKIDIRASGRLTSESLSASSRASSTARGEGTSEMTQQVSLPSPPRSSDTSVTVTPGPSSLSEKPAVHGEEGRRIMGLQEDTVAPLPEVAPQGPTTSSEHPGQPPHPALSKAIASRPPEICQTEGCTGHVSLLTRHLNRSIDPCDDFGAYVCSAWRPSSDSYLLGTSVMSDVFYSWFRNFNRTLYEGTKKLHVGVKPLAMYASCMSTFLHSLLKQHIEVMPLDKYYEYWRMFFEYLVTDKTFQRPNKSAVSDLANMERDILETLAKASSNPLKRPEYFALYSIKEHISKFSPSEWLNALNTNTDGRFNFTFDIMVLVSDKNYFSLVDVIFRSYENVKLLKYISWQFVQVFAVVADNNLFALRYGGGNDAQFLRQFFCAYNAEVPYQQLVSSLGFLSRFSKRDVNLVNAKFKNLIGETGKKLAALDWLDESSRNLILSKLSSVQLRLWPPQRYLVSEELERAYANFTSQEPSFAEYWAKTRKSLINAQFSPEFPDVSSQAPNYELPYFKYDAAINSVKVPIAALTWPLYYRDGTEAMFYGGLGYSLALQIMLSIGQEGQRWHPNGSIVETFLSQASSEIFQDKDKCLSAKRLFPDIPAIEVAYSALAASYTGASNPKRIRADLSEEQVFFMTLCYISCSGTSVVKSNFRDCNEVVKNFPNFAKAFDCPTGSKMRPRKQCTFFS